MKQLSPEKRAAAKVIAKACSWYDQRKVVLAKPEDPRENGRYRESRRELADAVERYRKVGGQP